MFKRLLFIFFNLILFFNLFGCNNNQPNDNVFDPWDQLGGNQVGEEVEESDSKFTIYNIDEYYQSDNISLPSENYQLDLENIDQTNVSLEDGNT